MPRLDVEDLSAAIATGSDVFSVLAESHTADYAVVLECVHEVDIQHPRYPGVEKRKPVCAFLLLVWRQTLGIEIGKVVANRR